MTESVTSDFDTWIDRALAAGSSGGVVAFNFNLYEEADAFSVELIGAPSFDEDDSDWACDNILKSAVPRFPIPFQIVGSEWRTALSLVQAELAAYLSSNLAGAARLKESKAVTVGFVDGDLELVWRKAQPSIQADAFGAA